MIGTTAETIPSPGERHIFVDAAGWPVEDPSSQRWHRMEVAGVSMFGRYDHQSAWVPLTPHTHGDQFEISLLVKGRQTYRIGEKCYNLKGGEQFVTLPHELHDTGDHVQEKGILFWMILASAAENNRWLCLNEVDAEKVISELRALPSRHFVANPESHLLLEELYRLLQEKPSPVHTLQAETLLLQYLFQTINAARTSAVPEISHQVLAALDAVAECRDDEWIALEQLAARSGWSEAHFKSRFRREMGMPPAEYMVRRKIDLAKERLRSDGLRVTSVAKELGFSSSQYFATVFKRYAHQTPSQFVAGRQIAGQVPD